MCYDYVSNFFVLERSYTLIYIQCIRMFYLIDRDNNCYKTLSHKEIVVHSTNITNILLRRLFAVLLFNRMIEPIRLDFIKGKLLGGRRGKHNAKDNQENSSIKII